MYYYYRAATAGTIHSQLGLKLEHRTQVRIRLHGIDAPETGQDFGSRAKQAASSLAFGKTVTVRTRDTDRFGRMVAEVILPDGRLLNREMVREGLAWRYRKVPYHGVIDPRPWPSVRDRLEEGLPRVPVPFMPRSA